MSTNGSPPKTTNMAPIGALCDSPQRPEDNVGVSDNNAGNTPSKDTQSGLPPNRFQPPPGHSYLPLQLPFPGAHQFYHPAPCSMTPSSQPSSSATQGYPSHGPSWQGYNFHPGGYGGSQMFPPQQFPGRWPPSVGAPRVPPALPGNNPVSRGTSSASTPYGQLHSTSGWPPISHPTKQFHPAAEPHRTEVAGIVEMPPLPEISYNKLDAEWESDDSSDLGGAEGKAPISLRQTEFSLTQFGTRMGQPNFSTFNKWKKVCVAGFLENKHWSNMPGQNLLQQLRDGSLHWETAVANVMETFETWLPWEKIDTAELIRWQWVEMIWKKCAGAVREERKMWRRASKWLARCLGERVGNKAICKTPDCQIQLSWLWFVECQTARMTRHLAINSKLRTQMWGTGRSW